MAATTEKARNLAFLLSEANGTLSRESVTIVSGAGVLEAGTVLGKITASGKYDAYDNTTNTGIEVADCVLAYEVDATSADVAATVITRLAEVNSAELTWAAANNGAAITAGKADLATKYVIAR